MESRALARGFSESFGRSLRHRRRGRNYDLNSWIRHPIVDLSTYSTASHQTDCDQPFQMSGHVRLRAAEDVAEILDS